MSPSSTLRAVVAACLLLPGCSADTLSPDGPTLLRVAVDPIVTPALEQLPDGREVTAVAGPSGRAASFVVDELVLATDDPDALQAFLDRWSGHILTETNPAQQLGVNNLTRFYRVRVQSELANATELAAKLGRRNPYMRTELRGADERALRLLTIAADATESGLVASANWLLPPSAISNRSTQEAPSSSDWSYSPDAFQWPAFSEGSAQDFGVGEAWRILDATGRSSNRVTIAVMDGGFMPSPDLPPNTKIYPEDAWNRENAYACTGGSPCPWHGTAVATAALGIPDNGFGAAGPGGTVADAVLVQSPALNVGDLLDYAFNVLPKTMAAGPRIVNISAGGFLPAAACLVACPALDLLTWTIRTAGILVVASAGNENADVDEEECFAGICWEKEVVVPCELSKVTCVGGLDWDATVKSGGSNYGSNPSEATSVDIFGPYGVYVGPNPDDNGKNIAKRGYGTSYSAPFIAGVAAMVWAANPALSANEVESILLDTSKTGSSDSRVPRWADAKAAVTYALGGDAPPYVTILGPSDGTAVASAAVPLVFEAQAEDREGPVEITWQSDLVGLLGHGPTVTRSGLRSGRHQVVATAVDSRGWTATDRIVVEVANTPPQATLLQPTPGARIYRGQRLHLSASSYDLDLAGRLPEEGISWTIDGAPVAEGHLTSVAPGTLSLGAHELSLIASDGDDTVTESITLWVDADPPNLPPSVVITAPISGGLGDVEGQDAIGWYRTATLLGKAHDPEDGELGGESLQWYVAGPGAGPQAVGTGTVTTVRLYAPACGDNQQIIQLVATDAQGQSSTFTTYAWVHRDC